MVMSLGGHVTIFSDKITLKMAAELTILFKDHTCFKDIGHNFKNTYKTSRNTFTFFCVKMVHFL